MLAPELLAAMASGCWAVGALFSANASNSMGAFAFTRWRLFFAMCMLWMAAFYGYILETSFTVCTGHIVNTLGPNGLGPGSRRQLSISKYPRS